jgi:hypothetical protein
MVSLLTSQLVLNYSLLINSTKIYGTYDLWGLTRNKFLVKSVLPEIGFRLLEELTYEMDV